ncbi:MAG: hypothetical protein H3C27_08585 [Opitutaceae bacterium]|nr:hypothetical protein [Opitutaceae bacterium]
MLAKIQSFAKKPSTYVILAIGAVLAFAYGRYLGPLATVASKLPKAGA